MLLVSASETLALFGCHDVNATRYLGHFLTVTFGALRLRFFVLSDGFGALEEFAACFTAILVGRHVSPHPSDQMVPMKSRFSNSKAIHFASNLPAHAPSKGRERGTFDNEHNAE
jgi:hypothetical protein